ncbi:MAG: FliH/SctL family protein [Armatimonadota bacterium]|nr:FliH/SctL family protein [Armatimonadota bacterium]
MARLIKRGIKAAQDDSSTLAVKPIDLEPVGTAPQHDELSDPIERANKEAQLILQSAREQAQLTVKHAEAEGFRVGLAQAAERAAELLGEIQRVLEETIAARNALIDDTEPVLLKLITQCVEKITRHEIRTDPRVVERALRACLGRVKNSDEIWVRVSPADVERVKEIREELLAVAGKAKSLHVSADPQVEQGGCIVESSCGTFDAQLVTQFERVREKLVEAFGNGR